MFLAPILRNHLCPVVRLIKRDIRPSIKIDKETFQLCLDVHQFTKDEIRVKAKPEYVLIEGKQERKTKEGFVIRQFVRKFKLPIGCNPETIKTELSHEGILTITAPRKFCDKNLPCERVIPISYTEPDTDEKTEKIESSKPDPCSDFKRKS